MFKIFVSDGVQDGFLTHSKYETFESCVVKPLDIHQARSH